MTLKEIFYVMKEHTICLNHKRNFRRLSFQRSCNSRDHPGGRNIY